MNLKYYLRGLGLGIVMTAIIMGIASPAKKETLTDKEIICKAKELGMIDDTELAEYLEKARAETEERVREEAAKEYAAVGAGDWQEADADLEKEADVQREPEEAMEEESQPEGMMDNEDEAGEALAQNEDRETEADEAAETVIFTVKKGEPAYSIEDRMKEEGLLPEDVDFDRFLVDNGYDTKIVAAEYEIPIGVDMETIARIITKQR